MQLNFPELFCKLEQLYAKTSTFPETMMQFAAYNIYKNVHISLKGVQLLIYTWKGC